MWKKLPIQITIMQKEFRDLEIKSLGKYHDLYLKSNTLLLVDFLRNLEKCT